MAIKQPLLPGMRVRDAEVQIVELDHRRDETPGVVGEFQGKPVGARLSGPGGEQLDRTEREGEETEDRDEEWEARHVPCRPDPEGWVDQRIGPSNEGEDSERDQ
jgi:hypothetical protein